ncbi:hypothetical protein Bca52824_033120 [Brassica carinata]|uniref:Uncharacterized protein n=1 Tax=Brassica carinata TaxID=52824 RepID=A0A8X7V6T5_BRACI|nr:hypothetical protein Bca52824_033120 [Brassica carinata]
MATLPFRPTHTNYGYTMYVEELETLDTVEGTIRKHYGLVDILTERSWLTEITLLVTLGAKSVVEYEFLPHPIFSIGSTTYVVDVTHDARSKATYDSLVFGERLAKSERVMNEIFGDKEMLIFHRVALEMGFEDSGLGS